MIRLRYFRSHALYAGTLALSCFLLPLEASHAQSEVSPQRLEALRKAVEEGRAHRNELAAERARLEKELAELKTSLVAAADQLAGQENKLTELEKRAHALAQKEARLTTQLKARRHSLAGTLAALQRLGRTPPSTLALRPDDALKAARSAGILSYMAPRLEADARRLRADLGELKAVRLALARETKDVALASRTLETERARLDGLIAERNKMQAAVSEETRRAEAELTALARKAKDLESLIAELEARATRIAPRPKPPIGAEPKPAPDGSRTATGKAKQPTKVAKLPDISGSAPSRFSEARGRIRLPVQGRVIGRSSQSGPSGSGRGAILESRPGAQVVSPFDGEVRFAGPFRDYGHILIIEVGDGYHVVLAGMARLNAIVGQRLLAGEPVGVMGSATATKSAQADGGKGWPRLYLELRKDGQPIDPLPWFASADEKVSG